MKKATKILITAAAVAAVAGVGAVSYAAWSQGSASATITSTTGSIVTVGSLTATSNITGTGALALVPYNQVDQFKAADMTKLADIQFTASGAGTGVSYTIQLTAGTSLNLYYKVGKTSDNVTAPSTTMADAAAWTTAGWAAVPTSATAITMTPGTDHVYVVLDSSNTSQMNTSFTIEFAVVAPSVS